ncbi:hypothetical protein Nepgr_005023 [Nepenthes gracilis]|uniref:Uncharacterized protein n=1 Tax=Nepenthes gracilis TaxID=150966 RepID=A0AAD3S2F5_NEPGR|nr:hypothetical protein Nepgr_005023 [Nepenthes gracilis]
MSIFQLVCAPFPLFNIAYETKNKRRIVVGMSDRIDGLMRDGLIPLDGVEGLVRDGLAIPRNSSRSVMGNVIRAKDRDLITGVTTAVLLR